MIVTIDGPAGSGKSTVAQQVADRQGWMFLDTGAMYRAVAWKIDQLGLDLNDADGIGRMCCELDITFQRSGEQLTVLVDGTDVTDALRDERISQLSSAVATVPEVRQALVAKQRELAGTFPDVVTEGRDQGSVVFPSADVKVFLDASIDERARRRLKQLREQGQAGDYEQILDGIKARDAQDRSRPTAPLVVPEGAVAVDTTGLSLDQVVTRIVALIDQARSS